MHDTQLSALSSCAFKPLAVAAVLERRLASSRYLRIVAEIAVVALTTGLAYQFHLNLAAASLLELLLVLAVALNVSFGHAAAVSFLAFACLDYFFIPPVFAFNVADPQNWVALLAFETSALVVSRLSTERKRQSMEATKRRAELEQLYEISRRLLLLGREQLLHRHILSLIQNVFQVEAAALFDPSVPGVELVGNDAASLEAGARRAYLHDQDSQSADARTWFPVLRIGVRPIGALALRGHGLSLDTANALASLTSITLERAHALERESRAEAERQSEQLRTTVLDALAHEYKTPLTAIRAATGGLLEMGQLNDSQSELITLIDSETRRLSGLTTRLLQMSRLDTADIRLRPENIEADELIWALLSSAKSVLLGRATRVAGLESGACVRADRELVLMALTQFLDNAAKYSHPASTITISVSVLAAGVRIAVHNFGPAIPAQDQERIFERFFRSPGSHFKAAGSGVGLSISKKVADAHGGRVGVSSQEGDGNTFFLELPACRRSKS